QLVELHRIPRVEGDDLYNFVDGKRIRRLAMQRAMRDQLVTGALEIVKNDGRYEIVPAEVAEKIRQRDERSVIPRNTAPPAAPAAAEDDPYKDYVVPDDLMWCRRPRPRRARRTPAGRAKGAGCRAP